MVKPDGDANHTIYGGKVAARDVLLNREREVPAPALAFVGELNRLAPGGKEGR